MAWDFDVIVIGSGFGGAVTACRLAEAGQRVLVLERGRRWNRQTYPSVTKKDYLWDENAPELLNGWFDLRWFTNMAVAQGAGVGGGSLVYANISVEAPALAFAPQDGLASWPAEITKAELQQYYDRVAKFMDIQELPKKQWNPRVKLMKQAAEAEGMGQRFHLVGQAVKYDKTLALDPTQPPSHSEAYYSLNAQGVEQGTCVHCGLCDLGCPVDARSTLAMNYIPWAEKHGARVRPLHLVNKIGLLSNGGYRVYFDRLEKGTRRAGIVTGRRVVVSAGSLGSTELLLRCRDEYHTLPLLSPQLGRQWSSNGDFLTPAWYSRSIYPSVGPTISCVVDYHDKAVVEGGGYWIQDGGLPNVLRDYVTSTKPQGKFGAWLMHKAIVDTINLDPTIEVMPWFAQGIDAGDGVFSLQRPWWFFGRRQFHLKWDVAKSLPMFHRIIEQHQHFSKLTGGTPIIPTTWSLDGQLITPHPLGGCGMGNSDADGVVDHACRVFNYPGLYVVDAAVFPRAIGVNPSRTIAAIAERAADIVIEDNR